MGAANQRSGALTTCPDSMTRIGHRPDVDGLRIIAIALGVLFHAFPTVFPGGFIAHKQRAGGHSRCECWISQGAVPPEKTRVVATEKSLTETIA